MDELRWILLLLGVALVAGIYYSGRRREARRETLLDVAREVGSRGADQPDDERPQELDGLAEQLDELNELLTDAPSARDRAARRPAHEPASGDATQKIIAIHVAAPRGATFAGADLQRVFAERGYVFGEYDIYHSMHEQRTVFSIVNMVKPGWFDPESMEAFTTPGISLFLQLPGPLAANVALDVLLAEARALARELGGSLQDATHSTLTQQTIQHLKEEVQAFVRATQRRDSRNG